MVLPRNIHFLYILITLINKSDDMSKGLHSVVVYMYRTMGEQGDVSSPFTTSSLPLQVAGGGGGGPSENTLPAPTLQSKYYQEQLRAHLINPILQMGESKIMAFRLSWLKADPSMAQSLWNSIANMRDAFDLILKQVPGVECFVSALTATAVKNKKDTSPKYNIYPRVGYWLVCSEQLNLRDLYDRMDSNPYGTTMKLVLQPYQKDEKAISSALFSVVKDNIVGMVRRTVDSAVTSQSHGRRVPIVKVVALTEHTGSILNRACNHLNQARFEVEFEQLLQWA